MIVNICKIKKNGVLSLEIKINRFLKWIYKIVNEKMCKIIMSSRQWQR